MRRYSVIVFSALIVMLFASSCIAGIDEQFAAEQWTQYTSEAGGNCVALARIVIRDKFSAIWPGIYKYDQAGEDDRLLNSGTIIGQFLNAAGKRPTSVEIETIFRKASVGDVVQMYWDNNTPHSAIIAGFESDRVWFLHSHFGALAITNNDFTWEELAENYSKPGDAGGFTIYRFSGGSSQAQAVKIDSTTFPDENFRRHVSYFDTNNDGTLSVEEISNAKNLDISNRSYPTRAEDIITSIKGIEYLTALESFSCAWHNDDLTEIDLSKNTALKYLDCSRTGITTLDLSKNTSLQYLECYFTPLVSLDLRGHPSIEDIDCTNNSKLIEIDVSNCRKLRQLECYSQSQMYSSLVKVNAENCPELGTLICHTNHITELNISGDIALYELKCYTNELTELDVSTCIMLTELDCNGNTISGLDLSACTELKELRCSSNQLKSLDLHNNTKLQRLFCASNQLVILDLSDNVNLEDLNCSNNQLVWLNVDNCRELGYNSFYAANGYGGSAYLICNNNSIPALNIGGCYWIKKNPSKLRADPTTEIVMTHVDNPLTAKTAPIITTSSISDAAVNKSYSFQLRAEGPSPITWSTASTLPSGLSLSRLGLISGKPTKAGSYTLTIEAINSYGTTSKDITLLVVAAPSISTSRLKNATSGKSYKVTLKAKGTKPFTWTASGLPEGLTLDSTSGKITGATYLAGTFSVNITAKNSAGTSSKTLTLTVKASAPKLSGKLGKGMVGQYYSSSLTLKQGTKPITWSIEGTYPNGLKFDTSTGILSGTPSEKWNAKVKITASNSEGSKSKKVRLTITEPSIIKNYSSNSGFYDDEDDHEEYEYISEPAHTDKVSAKYDEEYIVVATLPEIEPETSGMHDFEIILSDDVDIGLELKWVANSSSPSDDDTIAEFFDSDGMETLTVPDNHRVTLSAWLNEGITYRPEVWVRLVK